MKDKTYKFAGMSVIDMNSEELMEVVEYLAEENERLKEEVKKYKTYYYESMRKAFEGLLKEE